MAISRLHLNCDGTRAENRFRLSAKRTSPFKSAGASVQSATGSRGVRISGINAGCNMFRGSVKGTGYLLHSPVSPSLPLPCVTVCPHVSIGLIRLFTTSLREGNANMSTKIYDTAGRDAVYFGRQVPTSQRKVMQPFITLLSECRGCLFVPNPSVYVIHSVKPRLRRHIIIKPLGYAIQPLNSRRG